MLAVHVLFKCVLAFTLVFTLFVVNAHVYTLFFNFLKNFFNTQIQLCKIKCTISITGSFFIADIGVFIFIVKTLKAVLPYVNYLILLIDFFFFIIYFIIKF